MVVDVVAVVELVAVPGADPVAVLPDAVLVDPVPTVLPVPPVLLLLVPLVVLFVVVPVGVAGGLVMVPVTPVAVVADPVVTELLLSDAVCVTPLANLVVALADVIFPLASILYCAVPVPAPHAVSMAATPVKVVSEIARMAVMFNDTLKVKSFSYVNYLIPIKRSHANACVRALLYEKSSQKN